VEHGTTRYGAPALSATVLMRENATGGAAALFQIFRDVKGMPNGSCIVGNVIALLLITRLMIRRLICRPRAKKPPLPVKGEGWECPCAKAKVAGKDCDLTYSHA